MSQLETYSLSEIKSMDSQSRLAAIQEIWDTFKQDEQSLQLSDNEKRLLDMSAKELDKDPDSAMDWHEFRSSLKTR